MEIQWLGHACFKLSSDRDSIVLDPYADYSVDGFKPLRVEADLVLCSHEHGDHNYREAVKLSGKTPLFDVEIIDTYHDDVKGSKRGLNKIHIINDGLVRVAHLGDLGCDLEADQIEQLKGLDALMIPIGGFYTIDSDKALEIVKILKPRVVIPMHYRGESFGFDVLEKIDNFVKGSNNVKYYDTNIINIDKNTAEQTAILNIKPGYSEEIKRKIIGLAEKDSQTASRLAKEGTLAGGYNPEMEKVHLENSRELESIIQEYGFPTLDKVGERVHNAAWIVIQHSISRPDFMIKMLDIMSQLKDYEVLKMNLAYLEDRVHFYQRKPQRYGTQFDFNKNGKCMVWTLEDPARVNEYRKSVGMDTIEKLSAEIKDIEIPLDAAKELQKGMNEWLIQIGWCSKEDIEKSTF